MCVIKKEKKHRGEIQALFNITYIEYDTQYERGRRIVRHVQATDVLTRWNDSST